MKNFITAVLFLFTSISSLAQYLTSSDGKAWINGEERYFFNHAFRTDTSRNAYVPPGVYIGKVWDIRFSPNLFYQIYEAEESKYNKRKMKYIRTNVTWWINPGSSSFQALDPDYRGIAVLDDGRLLASEIKFDNNKSSLHNLYLVSGSKVKFDKLYTAEILQSPTPSPHNPRTVVSADNRLVAVFTSAGIVLVDVQQATTKLLQFPEIGAGWQIEEVRQTFFAEKASLLCISGAVTQGEGNQLTRKRFLTTVDVTTGSKVATLLTPLVSATYTAYDYRSFQDKVYKLDAPHAELTRISFSPGKIAIAESIKWDTTIIPQSMRSSYYPHLMQTGDTVTLALLPNTKYSRQDASAFFLNSGDGKLYKTRSFFVDQTEKFAKAQADKARQDAVNAANAAYEKKLCKDGEELARKYEGLSYMGPYGRTYILDWDCKAKQFIVGYFTFSLVWGPSGSAKKLPHHTIHLERGYPSPGQLSDDGKRVCTGCHGVTIGRKTLTISGGWTKRWVAGVLYEIKDDVASTTTTYYLCGVCKGAGTIPK